MAGLRHPVLKCPKCNHDGSQLVLSLAFCHPLIWSSSNKPISLSTCTCGGRCNSLRNLHVLASKSPFGLYPPFNIFSVPGTSVNILTSTKKSLLKMEYWVTLKTDEYYRIGTLPPIPTYPAPPSFFHLLWILPSLLQESAESPSSFNRTCLLPLFLNP